MSEAAAPIESVVIVGGGTAGWMAAAAASRYLNNGRRSITLVESDAIGTVGVGEATIPPILQFNGLLGIDEKEFVAKTGATFKLGIEFVNWGGVGERYLHPFGTIGRDFEGVAFHQHWLKHRRAGGMADFERFSMSAQAAAAHRFAAPVSDPRSPASQLAYAYHFDAGLYAKFLRERAEGQGVRRVEGRIASVERDGESGHVTALVLDDGRRVAGQFFIDCSGFRSLLLGETLGVGYRDWSHWLPCDRAIAVPSQRTDPLLPYTRATAREAGWQWRIPLQHRTGNGHVYSSGFTTDDRAQEILLANLDGAPTADPRRLSFKAGVREKLWEKNVVALGLSGGFLEPLESTSIHLIQTGISKLFWLFPDTAHAEVERREYNRLMSEQFDYIRDFIILHYKATTRADTPFWQYVRDMPIPDTLAHKIELFREKGRILRYDHDLFEVPSWVSVMFGQGIWPTGHDAVADSLDEALVAGTMERMVAAYADLAQRMPPHADHVARTAPMRG
ncbi:tryptophan halogenase [Sphingomonas sp. Leaf407]|uniref:tryptophan halogenase family protein n=1 Tax=unclassified Sphingomonas TaxID=196159 RepID=UPI0006FFB15F|nr:MULTISPECIES: tryptophan halogenase family protein [unclassified Sphingomonas]KQN34832.1 tryptophan halogenase [Sphingomonas sp. Leaf42]KQT25384.1 tryptophan halogenase [Sphingomonas sp. Leaf407]